MKSSKELQGEIRKQAFLSEQCKEIEENNGMGKTRDLFKDIRDTNRTFHAKMGTIKSRIGKDLTDAEEIKKRWQEYTEELYKKGLNDTDKRDGVVTHLEPDILECEVKWALESITTNKASGEDEIPTELFQIRKDDVVKSAALWKFGNAGKFGKLSNGHRTGNGQFSFQSQRKAMPKNVQTTVQVYSFHMLGR